MEHKQKTPKSSDDESSVPLLAVVRYEELLLAFPQDAADKYLTTGDKI